MSGQPGEEGRVADETEDLDRHERRINSIGPRPIQRLEESVVNRIAAGEIIQRPANALKELIENSLDAGATMIKVTLKEGGVKLLQIQDNGHGIRKQDLALLCERFATSKLREFSDLSRMSTFGFRGEALASISYVTASMNVVTKTRDSEVGFKAFYSEGALALAKPGQPAAPKVCAATDGTTITAEDLFYNALQRRRALGSASDEYNRCLDVVSRYAVHFAGRGVGFTCKRASTGITDISTPSSPTNTTHDAIRLLHGQSIARELVRLKPHHDEALEFKIEGWISGANWSAKKTTMLCFINERLVECPSLRKGIESLYSSLLPKGGHPWLYVSLKIAAEKVDVNVHPTKREVHFLDEDDIVDAVCAQVQANLVGANQSRAFQFSQILLPGASEPDPEAQAGKGTGTGVTGSKGYPRHSVRTDSNTQTLDAHFVRLPRPPEEPLWKKRKTSGDKDAADADENESMVAVPSDDAQQSSDRPLMLESSTSRSRSGKIRMSECSLLSVAELRSEIASNKHADFTEIIQNHTFVGVVDVERGLSLVQHLTKLYLINHQLMIEEFAYQLLIRQFGNLETVQLDPPADIEQLISIGLDHDADFGTSGLDQAATAHKICLLLEDKAEMLQEYFGIVINTETHQLESMPSPLRRYFAIPLENLPSLLMRLGPQVDWTEEKPCLAGIAREIAKACVPLPLIAHGTGSSGGQEASAATERHKWIVEHCWFRYTHGKCGAYVPSREVQKRAIFQVAAMSDLYRVFERC